MNCTSSNLTAELRTIRRIAWRLVLPLVVIAMPVMVAAQSSGPMSQNDIVVEVDQSISECPDGGYLPLQVNVTNRGPTATIRFETRLYADVVQSAERTLVLGQNATSRFTLLVPVVTRSSEGTLLVFKDGRLLDDVQYYWGAVSFRSFSGSMLVIADSKPDADEWLRWKKAGNSYPGFGSGRTEPVVSHLIPSRAYESWLAYTSLETVAVEATAFTSKLSETQRDELLRWVCAGGTLLVYNVNSLENKLAEFDKAINWDRRAAVGPGWSNQAPETAAEISRKPLDPAFLPGEPVLARGLMLGRVVVVRDNPFRPGFSSASTGGIESDSFWTNYNSLVDQRLANTSIRNGVNSRSVAGDFLEFVNPGIQIVPTWGFIVLITIFAIVIGPANYWFLKRRNRIGDLLWTTPLLALITTLSLLGWSSIHNGTGSRARLRSFTLLDQRSQIAVSLTRAALFSGRAPTGGIRFEPYTAVYPVWPQEDSFKSGSVDWTDAQVMQGDFHRSNTRSQFFIVTPHTLRSRLQIEAASNDQLPVTNGLEWSLERLLVSDHQGNLFVGHGIQPGESQKLEKASDESVAQFSSLIAQQRLVAPRASAPSSMGSSYSSYGSYSTRNDEPETVFASSYLERYLGWFQRDLSREGMALPRGTWLGIVSEPPGLDLGLKTFSTTEQLHVIMGVYDE